MERREDALCRTPPLEQHPATLIQYAAAQRMVAKEEASAFPTPGGIDFLYRIIDTID